MGQVLVHLVGRQHPNSELFSDTARSVRYEVYVLARQFLDIGRHAEFAQSPKRALQVPVRGCGDTVGGFEQCPLAVVRVLLQGDLKDHPDLTGTSTHQPVTARLIAKHLPMEVNAAGSCLQLEEASS